DPTFQQPDLRSGQGLAFRRHSLGIGFRCNEFDQAAVAGMSWDDGFVAQLTRFERAVLGVEPQPALLFFRSVTFETMLFQQRPNFPGKKCLTGGNGMEVANKEEE